MLTYPSIDPVALSLGPIQIHWYGIMYLLAFTFAWFLALRNSQSPWSSVKNPQVDDLLVYGAFGVLLAGRLGDLLFYSDVTWLADPTMVVGSWEGVMSFDGGLIRVGIALRIYSRKYQISFLSLVDFATPLVPTGLFFGRIGNFIGQEL